LSPQDRRRKQQLLLKKKAATKKQAEVVATAMAMANLSMDADKEPSDTESEDVDKIAKSKAAQHAAKREDMWRLMEEKREAHIVKEMEMARIVETPVTSGPPKNQQAITHFFAREVAVARKKLDDSVRQRREKGLNWYSRMRKTPEEIKRMQFQIRRRMGDERREAAEIRDAKARQKKEDEEKARRQDEKDKKRALALYNKHYKNDFAKKLNPGKNAKRQKVVKETKHMERDFAITNQLTDLEQQEWDEVHALAEAGDKVRQAEVDEIRLVKELTLLKYIPAVWGAGEGPAEERDADEAEVEVLD
jgi:hypothetical protein